MTMTRKNADWNETRSALLMMGLALVLSLGLVTPGMGQDTQPDACCPAPDGIPQPDASGEAPHAGHEDDELAGETPDEHAGHDHAAHAEESEAPEADGDEGSHEGHEEGGALRLTPEQRERFGIVIHAAGSGSLLSEVRLPGEIVFNEDRLVHLVPRSPGIAGEIRKTLGDRVEAGETLAVIVSTELAASEVDYFSAVTEVGCCQFELPRAQAIHDNVVAMLALLESSPTVDQLRVAAPGEMGGYGSRLISVYAEYVLTKKTYEREQALMAQKISSEGDFLAAENGFKKAQADYFGTRDSVAYEVRQQLLEITRDRQLSEFRAETAKQKLIMLGLTESEIAALAPVPQSPGSGGTPGAGHVCTDPNCKECAKDAPAAGAPTSGRVAFGVYEVKAPFGGVIVEKHITRGESLDTTSEIFTIADISSVWVHLTVYTKNLGEVQRGQSVALQLEHSSARTRAEVAMVTPFVDATTRTATARAVVDNSDGRWVPGTFVTGFISTSQTDLPVVLPRDAVQRIEGRDVVFTEDADGFEMLPVTLGSSDHERVEITAGLTPGTPYVAEGAYQLKATVITSNLGSHAGHGH